MATHETERRCIDSGGPFFVSAHGSDCRSCGHGVVVELGSAANERELTLRLGFAEKTARGAYGGDDELVVAKLSLVTGRCTPGDARAEVFFDARDWLGEAMVSHLDWLRERARRLIAQRDRTTSCFAALAKAAPGKRLEHLTLFPADWDLLFDHDGRRMWASPQHCPNANCPCTELVVSLYDITTERASHVGDLIVDVNEKRAQPMADSDAAAAKFFQPMWARHGAEMQRRHAQVRRAVARYAEAQLSARARIESVDVKALPRPRRQHACPCGSGKKYKRCCEPSPVSLR